MIPSCFPAHAAGSTIKGKNLQNSFLSEKTPLQKKGQNIS